MKKIVSLVLAAALAVCLFAGCAKKSTELVKIKVGASPTPHAEILELVKDDLKEKGYELEIVVFTDYVQPNLAVESKDLDANYFQHIPYLDSFNAENGTKLVTAAAVHYEPYGLYPGKTKTIDELQDGATISVTNDPSNEARALLLLEAQGIIKLKEGIGLEATVRDIVENPKNVKIMEIEAAQLARSLEDVDMAVINGNYAIQAGLSVGTDAIAAEEADSLSADTYKNIIAIREGDENRPEIKALVEAVLSDKVRNFIAEKYNGDVIAMF